MRYNMKKLAGIAAIGLLAVTWGAMLVIGLFFEPSTTTWVAIVTAAALATEIAMWIGASIAGITVFQKIRDRLRLRRSA